MNGDRVICKISHHGRDYHVLGVFKSREKSDQNSLPKSSMKGTTTTSSIALGRATTRLRGNESGQDEEKSSLLLAGMVIVNFNFYHP